MYNNIPPIHPGRYLKIEILEPRGISVSDAARSLGVSPSNLGQFTNGKIGCSSLMAKRLSMATGIGVNYWLNMQCLLDIWLAERLPPPNNVRLLPKF